MKPPIIITALDLERLEALIDALPDAERKTKAALLDELSRAQTVSSQEVPPDTVTMNSKVRFRVDGEEFCLTLAYPKDAAPGTHISVLTPVGSALLGMKAGSSIEWPRPDGGMLKVSVLEILYQPESAGQYHR